VIISYHFAFIGRHIRAQLVRVALKHERQRVSFVGSTPGFLSAQAMSMRLADIPILFAAALLPGPISN
jgi:hypothetical protein